MALNCEKYNHHLITFNEEIGIIKTFMIVKNVKQSKKLSCVQFRIAFIFLNECNFREHKNKIKKF